MKYHCLYLIFFIGLLSFLLLADVHASEGGDVCAGSASSQQQRVLPYEVDFSTRKTYCDSLQNIRIALGERLPNFEARMNVFALRPSSSNTGHVFRVRGLPGLNGQHLDFVVAPDNLYLAGFVTPNNVFYRFTDLQRINHPDGIPTVNLIQGSNYNDLERIAGMNRLSLGISPYSLVGNFHALIAHLNGDRNINQLEARAILSFATVIAEALRFREIGREFGGVLDSAGIYTLTEQHRGYTLNWGGLGRVIPLATNENQAVQAGSVSFNTFAAIAAAVGIIMHCAPRRAGDNQQCSTDTVLLNGVIWDKATLSTFLPFYISTN